MISFIGNISIAYVHVNICFHPKFAKFSFENGQLRHNHILSIIRCKYYNYNQMKAHTNIILRCARAYLLHVNEKKSEVIKKFCKP